jgi:hypothetical protein
VTLQPCTTQPLHYAEHIWHVLFQQDDIWVASHSSWIFPVHPKPFKHVSLDKLLPHVFLFFLLYCLSSLPSHTFPMRRSQCCFPLLLLPNPIPPSCSFTLTFYPPLAANRIHRMFTTSLHQWCNLQTGVEINIMNILGTYTLTVKSSSHPLVLLLKRLLKLYYHIFLGLGRSSFLLIFTD